MEVSAQLQALTALTPERDRGIPVNRRPKVSGAGLHVSEKNKLCRPYRDCNPGPPAGTLVTIPTAPS